MAAALVLTLALWAPVFSRNPFALFYTAVLLSAWVGGLGPGVLAATLTVAGINYFILPSFVSIERGWHDLVQVGTFVGLAVAVSTLDARRQRAAREVQASEARMRRVVDSQLIGILFGTAGGTVTGANLTMMRVLGCMDGAATEPMRALQALIGKDLLDEACRHAFGDAIAVPHFETELTRCDGTKIPALVGAATLGGGTDEFVAFVLDIRERKQAERELQIAKEAALAANATKDRFLAVLSHELRTPLTPALMVAASLETNPDLPADVRDDIQMIRRNIDLEARLIDDLLDVTRISRGKLQLSPQLLDLHQLIHQVMNICHVDAERKRIGIHLDLNAEVPRVLADSARLHQVLWNVVKNAIKFTPDDGTVTVRTSGDATGLCIEVSDTGIGIEPQTLPAIFNAFEQAGQWITREYGGLGLGLTITRALVEAHGGTISAASEGPGCGAVFTINLAVANGPMPAPLHPRPLSVASNDEGLRLLMVEDHDDTRTAMCRLLRGLGYEVSATASVGAAMAIATQHRFDLVLSDLGLPDGSGLELMHHLRSRYGLKGIAMSG
ncbi:MAG: ATP-binding protein, partial [Solirubrobacteraceae bacterium]